MSEESNEVKRINIFGRLEEYEAEHGPLSEDEKRSICEIRTGVCSHGVFTIFKFDAYAIHKHEYYDSRSGKTIHAKAKFKLLILIATNQTSKINTTIFLDTTSPTEVCRRLLLTKGSSKEFTQNDVANFIGCSQSTVSNILKMLKTYEESECENHE